MKKFSFFAVFALAALLTVACGSKGQEATAEGGAEAAEAVQDGNKFEGQNFTLVYPKEWKETFASEGTLNASSEDGVSLDATYNDMGPAVSELNVYANNWKGMKEASGATVEAPDIEGSVLTIKSVADGKTEMHFVVMKEDKIGVAGSLKFPEGKEADFEPVLQSIIKSVAFK